MKNVIYLSHQHLFAEEIECKSEEGITIGLIDSLMTISKVLADRLKAYVRDPYAGNSRNHVAEALRDLAADSNNAYVRDFLNIHREWLIDYHIKIGTELGVKEKAVRAKEDSDG